MLICTLPCCPSPILSGSTSPPLPCVYFIYVYCILYSVQCVRRGGMGSVGDYILQEFYTLHLTRFRTYKIARPIQTKTWEGRGPQTAKHLPQSPLIGQFFRWRHKILQIPFKTQPSLFIKKPEIFMKAYLNPFISITSLQPHTSSRFGRGWGWVREEPNRTTPRKPVPLYIIQYSLEGSRVTYDPDRSQIHGHRVIFNISLKSTDKHSRKKVPVFI